MLEYISNHNIKDIIFYLYIYPLLSLNFIYFVMYKRKINKKLYLLHFISTLVPFFNWFLLFPIILAMISSQIKKALKNK